MNRPHICYVCGNPEVVQTIPVPLCTWHQTPPADGPVDSDDYSDLLLPWEEELEEYYRKPIDDFDIPVYPI